MKLAKAAAQKLKGVIVEYDVLCSTLVGRSAAEQAEQQRHKLAAAAAAKKKQEAESSFGAGFASVGNMFVSDVRSLLKDLNQDSTGKPWIVKDRLQSVLQGLPSQYLDKVTGDPDKELAAAGKSDDEIHLEKQLASASQELARMREEKEAARKEQERSRLERVLGGGSNAGGSSSGGDSSARAKYLDKINQLKAKAKSRPADAASVISPLDAAAADNVDLTSKGLSTWLVNDGANELLMDGQFDAIMSRDDYFKFPDPQPIISLCGEMGLQPFEVLVVARSSAAVRAAKAAGTHTCHFQFSESDMPNHNAHYRLTTLRDFQFLIEDFNGISYRGKTPEIVW